MACVAGAAQDFHKAGASNHQLRLDHLVRAPILQGLLQGRLFLANLRPRDEPVGANLLVHAFRWYFHRTQGYCPMRPPTNEDRQHVLLVGGEQAVGCFHQVLVGLTPGLAEWSLWDLASQGVQLFIRPAILRHATKQVVDIDRYEHGLLAIVRVNPHMVHRKPRRRHEAGRLDASEDVLLKCLHPK